MSTSYQLTDAELDRLATSFHEAGHAVAAVLLGGRLHRATIDEHPHTEYETLPTGMAAAVTFAGPWCEARWTHGRAPGPADLHRILTANPSDDRSLCAAGGPHQGSHVVPLLERSWAAVKALTSTLYFNGSADHSDVCVALSLGDDGGPGSLGLAMIRSGSGGPGSFATRDTL